MQNLQKLIKKKKFFLSYYKRMKFTSQQNSQFSQWSLVWSLQNTRCWAASMQNCINKINHSVQINSMELNNIIFNEQIIQPNSQFIKRNSATIWGSMTEFKYIFMTCLKTLAAFDHQMCGSVFTLILSTLDRSARLLHAGSESSVPNRIIQYRQVFFCPNLEVLI